MHILLSLDNLILSFYLAVAYLASLLYGYWDMGFDLMGILALLIDADKLLYLSYYNNCNLISSIFQVFDRRIS